MKLIIPIVISFVFVIFIIVSQFLIFKNEKFVMVFCNVGQGDAIYLRVDHEDILIDGGPDEKVLDCLSSYMPIYDRNIELMVLTHADLDHYGGLIDVLDSYSVSDFATSYGDSAVGGYTELFKKLKTLGIPVRRLTQGDRIKINEEVIIDVLWPPEGFEEIESDRNNTSLVFLIDFLNFEAVLTGDLDKEYLNLIVEDLDNIEIFKLGHHGSNTSTEDETFEQFRPALSVISAGKNNRYGHPHKEVLSLLDKYDLNYETTFEGDVVIVSEGNKFWLK